MGAYVVRYEFDAPHPWLGSPLAGLTPSWAHPWLGWAGAVSGESALRQRQQLNVGSRG